MAKQQKSAPSPDKARRDPKAGAAPAEPKPRDDAEKRHPDDMPGAAGYASARADEDTYD